MFDDSYKTIKKPVKAFIKTREASFWPLRSLLKTKSRSKHTLKKYEKNIMMPDIIAMHGPLALKGRAFE